VRDSRDYEKFIRNIMMAIEGIMGSIDEEMGLKLKEMLEFEDDELQSYYLDLMTNVRRGEITHIPNADLTLSKQQVIFGEQLKSFIERMSVGFINVKASMVLWDAMLIKIVKEPSDIITAFALILFHFKADFIRCKNIL
jgi:hypothetical protein